MDRKQTLACLVISLTVVASSGCGGGVTFPAESMPSPAYRAYDTNGTGQADFFLLAGPDGRVDHILYDTTGDGKWDQVVSLDAIPFARCRHLVIILDGFGYDVVKEFYDAGGLRMFHPPSKLVAPYPTLTDPALEDAFGYMPCRGFEAKYYDRRKNKVVGGAGSYLRGDNEPYNRLLNYRADTIMDAVGYVYPWSVFGKETNDAKRLFDRAKTRELLAYFVSSAGVSTRQGAAGQQKCLRRIERMVLQVLHETRGLVKVTILSDHGHSYTPGTRIDIEGHLKTRGWRLTGSLRGERDVAFIRFGLLTYASFSTRSPEALAEDLVELEGVELASFAYKDMVIVLAPGGARAIIRGRHGRYAYTPVNGDPLDLTSVLADVQADADGYYDADALLRATVHHRWPAPLQRLCRAHFGLVENPPDVIVSLADRFYTGSKGFAGSVTVASTHGGLNRRNSVTFIMSTAGKLPGVMRSRDIPQNMRKLTGEPFPSRK